MRQRAELPANSLTRELLRETAAKHRQTAFRLRARNLVLKDVPMLSKNAIRNAHDVRRDPVHRPSIARESSVYDHEIAFGHDHTWFVLERRRSALNQIEKSFPARLDMCTVLDVVR